MAPPLAVSVSPPAWILLDTKVRIGRRRDETTAQTVTSTGSPISVSVVAVNPPGVSHCVVHCPELTTTASGRSNMRDPPVVITGAGGRFLLLRVRFPERSVTGRGTAASRDVFVYTIGATPTLHLVPRPYPRDLHHNHVGILPCTDDSSHCFIVVPEQLSVSNCDLHVFSTETQSWSTKVARVYGGGGNLVWYEHTKVLAVGGGGALAWVDLRHGILLCDDVLSDDPAMRLIPLPPLMLSNNPWYGLGSSSDRTIPSLRPIRDVTCCANGLIKLVEMEHHPSGGLENGATTSRRVSTMEGHRVREDGLLCGQMGEALHSGFFRPLPWCCCCG